MKYIFIAFSLISVGIMGCGPQVVTPQVTQGVILQRHPEANLGSIVTLTGVEQGSHKACELRVFGANNILSLSIPGQVRFQIGFESDAVPAHSHCHGHGQGHNHGHDHGHGDCHDHDHADSGHEVKQFQYFPIVEFQSHDSATALIHAVHSQVLMKIELVDQGKDDELPKTIEVQAKLYVAGKKDLTNVTRVCVLDNSSVDPDADSSGGHSGHSHDHHGAGGCSSHVGTCSHPHVSQGSNSSAPLPTCGTCMPTKKPKKKKQTPDAGVDPANAPSGVTS